MTRKRFLILLGIVGLLITLIFFFRSDRERFDWRETYREESKEPYGTFIIFELLKTYFPGKSFEVIDDSLHLDLPATSEPKSNYVFIGEALYLDSVGLQALLRFVEAGHSAFISSRTIPNSLMEHLYVEECNDYWWEDYSTFRDTTVWLNLIDSRLRSAEGFSFRYLYRNQPKPYRWQYINEDWFCGEDPGLLPLGTINDSLTNFARLPYGEGFFFLHTTPIAFTNIALLEEEGLVYAGKIFSYLSDGPVFWDRQSRVIEAVGRRQNQTDWEPRERRLSDDSPLKYILSQPALAWAWYLLLAMGLLYLVFKTKRTQRIIPVLEPNTNTSLEFLTTIGRLYFLQNNHKQLALQKMKLFRSYIWDRYAIPTREPDSEFIDKLTSKSEVPKEQIESIFEMHRRIENSPAISAQTLIGFHQIMDHFYKNCK